MKKRVKFIFISFLLIVVCLIILFFRWYFSIKEKYFEDLGKLYSSFTPLMLKEINSHLKLLNCQPKKYRYDNAAICFLCGKKEACFPYTFVQREIKKMNPVGSPYLITNGFDAEVADFCYYGLASKFDCEKKNENILEGKNIKFVNENKNNIFKCEKINLSLIGEFKDFVNSFCKIEGKEPRYEKGNLAFCGEFIIFLNPDGKLEISKESISVILD
jgi:hypothetical protein